MSRKRMLYSYISRSCEWVWAFHFCGLSNMKKMKFSKKANIYNQVNQDRRKVGNHELCI